MLACQLWLLEWRRRRAEANFVFRILTAGHAHVRRFGAAENTGGHENAAFYDLAAAPKAEECISYQIPAFRLGGRLLVAFGAAAKHCAFYPGSYPVEAHRDELKAYDTSKGTIRFQAESPLPATLVRKLVKTRIAQHAAQQPVAAAGAARRR